MRGDLTEALARDDRAATVRGGDAVGDRHHIAAKNEREIVLFAVLHQFFLNVRQRHDVQIDAPRVLRHDPRKFKHFFARAFARVGERLEMHRFDLHAAFCHHVPRNGRIDPARKQEERLSARADGDAARSLELSRMDIRAELADLDVYRDLGVTDVHLQLRHDREHLAADLPRDFGRRQRESLVRPLRLDLESLFPREERREIFPRDTADGVHVLFANRATAHAHDPENFQSRFKHSVDVGALVLRVDHDRALRPCDRKLSEMLRSETNGFAEHILEIASVRAFENDLAVFAK